MQYLLLSALLVGTPFVAGAPAGAPVTPRDDSDLLARALVQDRDSCHADNLLRLLRTPTNLPEALPFCSAYLGIPASTSVVSTVTPVVTSSVSVTATLTDVLTSTITSTATTVSTETDTEAATLTVTVPAAVPKKKRTNPKLPLSSSVLCSYDPSRISSACACLTIPVAVSLTTATAPALTETSSATVTVETTTTATELSLTTATLETTVTTSTTSVATVTALPPAPAVPASFRLVSYDSTGAKVYYKRITYGLGDLLYQTADVSQAVAPMTLDADQHLTFFSTQYSAQVAAYYATTYFNNLTHAKILPFETELFISGGDGLRFHTWRIDPDTLALESTSVPGLVLQICVRTLGGGQRSLLFQYYEVEDPCIGVSLFVEAV